MSIRMVSKWYQMVSSISIISALYRGRMILESDTDTAVILTTSERGGQWILRS